jgi:TusA-related sulfurtransferase
VLAVLSTDPLAPMDLAVLCEQLGHRLVDTAEADGGHVTTLQKALKR